MIKQTQEHIGDETIPRSRNTVLSKVNKKYVKHLTALKKQPMKLMSGWSLGYAFIKSLQRICKKIPVYRRYVKNDS
jgi:hypothetical protein